MPALEPPIARLPRWLLVVLILGLYLSLRGYHSRDGDQAYRLPLLLHRQHPQLFANDPFVRAFDAFNPHRGALVLLDLASRPLGLSAGLALLFALTFAATCIGIDRLARSVWPEGGSRVGAVAVGLVLVAKAGNIGTNHLFEAMLLDRLVGFALGWLALAEVIDRPDRGWATAAPLVGLAMLIHPSVGLQLAMLLAGGWIVWGAFPGVSQVGRGRAVLALLALGCALLPGLVVISGQGSRLLQGLSPEEFRLLSVELQGPQHMLPHLWRRPQWLAWGCYMVLAGLSLAEAPRASWNGARCRFVVLLATISVYLGAAWVAIECVHDLRLTIFQPFRMATVGRGLALVIVSGRVLGLWRSGGVVDRARAALLAVGLAGDWMLVVATAVDVGVAGVGMGCRVVRERGFWPSQAEATGWGDVEEHGRAEGGPHPAFGHPLPGGEGEIAGGLGFGILLLGGVWFLGRHDTESGHWPVLMTVGVVAGLSMFRRAPLPRFAGGWARMVVLTVACWAVPGAAFLAGLWPADGQGRRPRWAESLCRHCRFSEVALDDVERLAVWCRENTPAGARFVGPPGPKTFRLWALRDLAFNRAGSPYHAQGLADWAERFRDHVGFEGPTETFVRAYVRDRHRLERRYDDMTDAQRAALAGRQGAEYVIAPPPSRDVQNRRPGPLELLRVEGRFAVYRVRPSASRAPAQARAARTASAGTG